MNNNKDPLGLTKPPPAVDWDTIEPCHTPEDADTADVDWNTRGTAWKFCFAVYRRQVHGDNIQDVAKMLNYTPTGGNIHLKILRLRNTQYKNDYAHRYVKFLPAFVDRWPKIALKELTKIHGDEEYAKSLLP